MPDKAGTAASADRSRKIATVFRREATGPVRGVPGPAEPLFLEANGMPDKTPATQGASVARALEGDRSIDIDRWNDFSKADSRKLAADPERSEPAANPAAGPACGSAQTDAKSADAAPRK
jgi:hypothetical protein